jgi:hypothetical protein
MNEGHKEATPKGNVRHRMMLLEDWVPENNCNSVVAYKRGFLPSNKSNTPHIKGKKCTEKNYTLLQLIFN